MPFDKFFLELVYTSRSIDLSGNTVMSKSDILTMLKNHGVMPTPQRMEVAEVLLDRAQHLSADQIMDRLRDAGSQVSKATVYNTLKLFCEKSLVKEVNVDPSRKFYDSTTSAHHHFYHMDTGQLSDIPADQVSIMSLPDLPVGTEQESVEVLIRVRGRKA
jgi:Fur family iron response transcriptional regulator